MRDYEILYIVRPDLDEEQLNEAVAKVSGLIETLGGQHERTNVWGKRRLAYEVNHLKEGYYVLTEFQIIDARTAENNERGDNSHDRYKERQFARVKARLMHGMKDDGAD